MWLGKQSFLISLLLITLVAPALAAPPVALPPPFPPGVAPHWAPVPGNHRVAYATNTPADLFLYGHHYYYYYGGHWYRGKRLQGPWHPRRKLPRQLWRIPANLFKTAPPR
jgi:hypothetical protein